MICLAFDTATPQGRFAAARDGGELAYQPYNLVGGATDALLEALDAVLAAASVRQAQIDVLAVTRGPGSFTGVRVGVATAKALAYALDRPLIAVDTLAAMAAATLLAHPEREWAVPALDARRGQVFAAVCRRRGGWVETVAPAAALAPDVWWTRVLAVVPDPEAPAYAGSGAALLLGEGPTLRPELASSPGPVLRRWSASHPATARALALAASRGELDHARLASPFALTPSYLRVSDAEVQRGLDLTPTDAAAGLAALEDRRRERER